LGRSSFHAYKDIVYKISFPNDVLLPRFDTWCRMAPPPLPFITPRIASRRNILDLKAKKRTKLVDFSAQKGREGKRKVAKKLVLVQKLARTDRFYPKKEPKI
jgi:hypothetical protein